MRFQLYPNGEVEPVDVVTEGPVALAAYNAGEAVVCLRFTEALVHNGIPIPEFTVQVFRVYRVAQVTENDVITVTEPAILSFLSRPPHPQFGPEPL